MVDGPLELETRRDIYALVRSVPGLHMRDIQRRLELSIALAEYHLRYLEEAGMLVSVEEGGYRRYYPATAVDGGPGIGARDRRVLSVLRQPVALRIALYLLTVESSTLSEVAAALERSPSGLSFHLKKLVRHGIVRRLERTEGRGYAIEDRRYITRLLLAYRPPPDMVDECAELWDSLSPV